MSAVDTAVAVASLRLFADLSPGDVDYAGGKGAARSR
jgi:hypothetical protein